MLQCHVVKKSLISFISLVGDVGFMCGGLKPLLAVGAAQVCQRASLLKPSIHTHLDVTVDIPAKHIILENETCCLYITLVQYIHVTLR